MGSVLEILKEKAGSGVDVRIIYDDIGCFLTLPSDFAKQLEQYGVKCVAFNLFRPFFIDQSEQPGSPKNHLC